MNWRERDWEKVLWSDESSYILFGGNGRSNFCGNGGERLNPHCVDKTVKYGGGEINV